MNYYLLECYGGEEDAIISSYPELEPPLDNWVGGERWAVEVPEPLVFDIWEEDEGQMLPMYKGPFPLMSDELVAALRECGVDNLDCYQAVIRETATGKEYNSYKAVNIIGVVRAADMAASNTVDLGTSDLIAIFFRHLELDESRIPGNLLLFRMAEAVSTIVVQKKVRDHLLSKGFEKLEFFEPSEWNG